MSLWQPATTELYPNETKGNSKKVTKKRLGLMP